MLIIDDVEVPASHFAYDGCHKIYLITNEGDLGHMLDQGWPTEDFHPISELPGIWEETCGLRFISGTGPEYKQYVEQCMGSNILRDEHTGDIHIETFEDDDE